MKPQKFLEKIANKAVKFINEERLYISSVTGEVRTENGKEIPYLILNFPNHESVPYNLKDDYDIHEEDDFSISQSFAYIKRNIMRDAMEYNRLREEESLNLTVESEESVEEESLRESSTQNSSEEIYFDNDEDEDYEEDDDADYEDEDYEDEEDELYDEIEDVDEDEEYSASWSDSEKVSYFSDYDTDYEDEFARTLVQFLEWRLPGEMISYSQSTDSLQINELSFNIPLLNMDYQMNSKDFYENGLDIVDKFIEHQREAVQTQMGAAIEEDANEDQNPEEEEEEEEDYDDGYFPFD